MDPEKLYVGVALCKGGRTLYSRRCVSAPSEKTANAKLIADFSMGDNSFGDVESIHALQVPAQVAEELRNAMVVDPAFRILAGCVYERFVATMRSSHHSWETADKEVAEFVRRTRQQFIEDSRTDRRESER